MADSAIGLLMEGGNAKGCDFGKHDFLNHVKNALLAHPPAERLADRPSLVACVHGLARLSQVEGDFDRATRLLAAAQSVAPDGPDRDEDLTALYRAAL